ncbi:amidase [Penicillium verhagenii]|nr:amidase [Penicillium verhagenii]
MATLTIEINMMIGQTTYHSRVTKREEWLPVAIGIIGPRGTDAAFTAFIQETLLAAKLPTTVDVGRTAFKVNITGAGSSPVVPGPQNTLHDDLK